MYDEEYSIMGATSGTGAAYPSGAT